MFPKVIKLCGLPVASFQRRPQSPANRQRNRTDSKRPQSIFPSVRTTDGFTGHAPAFRVSCQLPSHPGSSNAPAGPRVDRRTANVPRIHNTLRSDQILVFFELKWTREATCPRIPRDRSQSERQVKAWSYGTVTESTKVFRRRSDGPLATWLGRRCDIRSYESGISAAEQPRPH